MQKTLEKIITYAAYAADPERIILFGSMAANKINEYSDVDLLIISNNIAYKSSVIDMIASFSRELSLKTDVLLYSAKEIEKETSIPSSFIGGILKAGKVVWEGGKIKLPEVIYSITSIDE